MIPEPSLWADIRERDRNLDEMSPLDFPPHHPLHPQTNTGGSSTLSDTTLPSSSGSTLPRLLLKESGEEGDEGETVRICGEARRESSSQCPESPLRSVSGRSVWTRRWYLLVIVLLYIGLLASFSLNVSLLLRKTPAGERESKTLETSPKEKHGVESFHQAQGGALEGSSDLGGEMSSSTESSHPLPNPGYTYTTSCLVKVPCESGSYWKCESNDCEPCALGFYQPQWGQTSCWQCPYNTTTDRVGATSPTDCKRHKCPFYTKEGLGILESPNFPGEYPASVECHWRVRRGRNKRVLVIISNIELDPDCGDTLRIRKTDRPKTGVIFETCQSNDEPIIFTGHSRNLWIDFTSNANGEGRGFQISVLTIEDELGYLVDAIVSEEKIGSFDKRPGDMSIEDKHLLSRLLMLLNAKTNFNNGGQAPNRNRRKKKPIINVIEED